jgi:hypothetical protein
MGKLGACFETSPLLFSKKKKKNKLIMDANAGQPTQGLKTLQCSLESHADSLVAL